ncbi:glycosyl transferase [Thoreauomyces humboldtii]|nr:glycosyl transferase [Thoreauomyces humboldtii]
MVKRSSTTRRSETSLQDALNETSQDGNHPQGYRANAKELNRNDHGPLSWGAYAPTLVFATIIKLLLIPSYHSTDFEVHRNWLGITSNLPIAKWYYEETSEWTLDYPPFFAWFEYLLAQGARIVHPAMLDLDAQNHATWQTVYFQRFTVIVSELVFLYGAGRVTGHAPRAHRTLLLAIVFLSPGLAIVDHIHFQYNGLLYGVQLLSTAAMMEDRQLLGGILFAVVLNFKHIYLYQAPAYFVYILRAYCYKPDGFSWKRFIAIGSSTLGVFAISFGPFASHLPQIISRLFPFKRGLCHAYWAPNVWALYAFADRVLIRLAPILKIQVAQDTASFTRGLVGDTVFGVLPSIQPLHTMILTIISQLPVLAKLWMRPTTDTFLDSLILCGFGSYLFGWHVHEKAILLVLIPLSLAVQRSPNHGRAFYILSYVGCYSLFPLLFKPAETLTKTLILATFAIFGHHALRVLHSGAPRHHTFHLKSHETAYLALSAPLFLYAEIAFPLLDDGSDTRAFLPLLLTSVYCAGGILYGWALLYWDAFLGY